MVSFLKDDFGGCVCMGCPSWIDSYVTTLYAYSSYTKRSFQYEDVLFFAVQTVNYRTVVVEFPRIPYRLFLSPEHFKIVREHHVMIHTDFRHCTRVMDSLNTAKRDFIEVRLYLRVDYKKACYYIKKERCTHCNRRRTQ